MSGAQYGIYRRIEPTTRQRACSLLVVAGPPVGLALGMASSTLLYGATAHDLFELAVSFLVALGLATVLHLTKAFRESVEIRPEGLVVHRSFRHPDLCPWPTIGWIGVGRSLGARVVQVQGPSGLLTLPVPTHARWFPNPAFDADAAEIIAAWEAHRSPYWQAPRWALPPPPAPV